VFELFATGLKTTTSASFRLGIRKHLNEQTSAISFKPNVNIFKIEINRNYGEEKRIKDLIWSAEQ